MKIKSAVNEWVCTLQCIVVCLQCKNCLVIPDHLQKTGKDVHVNCTLTCSTYFLCTSTATFTLFYWKSRAIHFHHLAVTGKIESDLDDHFGVVWISSLWGPINPATSGLLMLQWIISKTSLSKVYEILPPPRKSAAKIWLFKVLESEHDEVIIDCTSLESLSVERWWCKAVHGKQSQQLNGEEWRMWSMTTPNNTWRKW